jgi:hypothetical protein
MYICLCTVDPVQLHHVIEHCSYQSRHLDAVLAYLIAADHPGLGHAAPQGDQAGTGNDRAVVIHRPGHALHTHLLHIPIKPRYRLCAAHRLLGVGALKLSQDHWSNVCSLG